MPVAWERPHNVHRMWHSTRAQLLARLGAFCVATVLLLFIMYQPARQVFRSTGDVALYQRYARLALASPPALPREYPPASALIFVVPQLIAPSSYPLVFALLAA